MKALFIGGTGNISLACTRLAAARGWELTLLNRGQRAVALPAGVRVVQADAQDAGAVRAALGDERFDVAANFIAFTPEDVQRDLDVLEGRVGQYLFVSSASAYQKPPTQHVITESTPLANPYWEYSRNKIACEDLLMQAHRERGFPGVTVRPSHTYSRMMLPLGYHGGKHYAIIKRMLEGRPVIVHGDGTSLWVLTHAEDFAKAFVGLMGLSQSAGHAFHITSDEVLTWNQIYGTIAGALGSLVGREISPKLVHISSEFICRFDESKRGSLLGDKGCSVVFDNSKVKRFVPDYVATIPFSVGVRGPLEAILNDPARQVIDEGFEALYDRIIAAHEGAR